MTFSSVSLPTPLAPLGLFIFTKSLSQEKHSVLSPWSPCDLGPYSGLVLSTTGATTSISVFLLNVLLYLFFYHNHNFNFPLKFGYSQMNAHGSNLVLCSEVYFQLPTRQIHVVTPNMFSMKSCALPNMLCFLYSHQFKFQSRNPFLCLEYLPLNNPCVSWSFLSFPSLPQWDFANQNKLKRAALLLRHSILW